MSALRLPEATAWRPLIVKLYHTTYSMDAFADRLYSHGYEVINTTSYANTIKAAREIKPALLIVHDDPAYGIDALEWIALQHTDSSPTLAMIPLIVLAAPGRLPVLRREQQADRVAILQSRADTLNQLTRTVKRMLRAWDLDQPPQ